MQWPRDRRINNGVMKPVSRKRIGKYVPAAKNTHAAWLLLETLFSTRSVQRGYKVESWGDPIGSPCGCGVEYLHRSPASRRWWRKGEPSVLVYNRVCLFLGVINTGTLPSRLGESRIWDNKMWSWVPRDSDLKMTALARASSSCKRQTHPLVRNLTASVQLENKITGRGS
jgi:hypothetical protein